MKNIKSHFVFTTKQRRGIFLWVLLLLLVQVVYIFYPRPSSVVKDLNVEAFQKEIDSLYNIEQNKIAQIKPFNPNFISDYKGYKLGLSVLEINRLHEFRRQNKYVNSALEFQQVTKISDSLLKIIKPHFKFPDWVVNKTNRVHVQSKSKFKGFLDVNNATKEQFKSRINLNYKIINRIVNFRNALGGFVKIEQLRDVYGLSESDYKEIKQNFRVKSTPQIKKININLATEEELASLVYINNSLSKEIVEERTLRDGFKSLDDLKYVKGFPVEKMEHVLLYIKLK